MSILQTRLNLNYQLGVNDTILHCLVSGLQFGILFAMRWFPVIVSEWGVPLLTLTFYIPHIQQLLQAENIICHLFS
jgi:hypothetical protein